MILTTLGFDPGLRHGSLIQVTFDLGASGEADIVVDLQVLTEWTEHAGIHINTTEVDLNSFGDLLLNFTKGKDLKHIPIGIEWDPSSVYYRGTKLKQAVTTSYLIGYLSRGWINQGISPVYLTPAELRRLYSIPSAEKKTKERLDLAISLNKGLVLRHSPVDNIDTFDALLLAYAVAKATT